MPICLKCGKEIEPGKEYCEDCGATDEEQVERLVALSAATQHKPPRRADNRWLILSIFAFALILFAVAVAFVFSIPTGPQFAKKAQAGICRANLRQIQRAIDSYLTTTGKYPPTGRVDNDHPLVKDQYLPKALQCPTTHHYYIIVKDGPGETVKDDSGLPGHSL